MGKGQGETGRNHFSMVLLLMDVSMRPACTARSVPSKTYCAAHHFNVRKLLLLTNQQFSTVDTPVRCSAERSPFPADCIYCLPEHRWRCSCRQLGASLCHLHSSLNTFRRENRASEEKKCPLRLSRSPGFQPCNCPCSEMHGKEESEHLLLKVS